MTETFIVLLVVLGIIAAASIFFKNDEAKLAPVIVAAAAVGALAAGMGLRIRELVEGPFAYLDSVLAVLTGMLFVIMLMDNGTFELLFEKIITKKRSSFKQALLVLLFVALPGIFTGTAAACILTTGTMVGTYLIKKGIEKAKALEFVAVGALLGLLLPPICLPAMITVVSRSGSFPASFEGYTVPLLVVSLPALLVYAGMSAKWIGALGAEQVKQDTKSSRYIIPLAVVAVLLFCHNFLFAFMPFLGYPLIFVIGTILAILLPVKKMNALKSSGKAVNMMAPVVATAFAVASALEILTLTGATGKLATIWYTVSPSVFTVAAMAVIVLCGVLVGGPFSAMVGVTCSYVIGAIAYEGNEMFLIALSAALCTAIIMPLRGGVVASAAAAIGAEGTDAKKIISGAAFPVALILVIGIIYAVAYKNLGFLIV